MFSQKLTVIALQLPYTNGAHVFTGPNLLFVLSESTTYASKA